MGKGARVLTTALPQSVVPRYHAAPPPTAEHGPPAIELHCFHMCLPVFVPCPSFPVTVAPFLCRSPEMCGVGTALVRTERDPMEMHREDTGGNGQTGSRREGDPCPCHNTAMPLPGGLLVATFVRQTAPGLLLPTRPPRGGGVGVPGSHTTHPPMPPPPLKRSPGLRPHFRLLWCVTTAPTPLRAALPVGRT